MIKSRKRVVVLGAGASCSYADSPTGQRPPLANEIIPAFFRLEISENRHVLVGNILNYVQQTRGIEPEDFRSWNSDIERFLTEIDQAIVALVPRIIANSLTDAEFQALTLLQNTYNQLIFLFASILNEIQNGPVSIPYALLASELGPNDTCITFNWDTLLDRALASTGKWSPANGYAIEPDAIFDDGWQQSSAFESQSCGPQYLKLHGSTNWLTPHHSIDFSTGRRRTLSSYAIDKLYIFLRATREYKTYEGRYWGPYEPYSYCYYPPDLPCQRDDTPHGYRSVRFVCAPDLPEHGKHMIDDKSVYSMPLIVPPVKDKQYLRYGKIFSLLWEKGSQALSECEELYVIGYSFPATDTVSKDLFRTALKKNRCKRRIVIWNPHAETLLDLFTKDFGVDRNLLYVNKERFDPLQCSTSPILLK
jgi:hypothetical protein